MRKLLFGFAGVMGLAGLAQAQSAAPAGPNPQDIIVGRQAAYELMQSVVDGMKAGVASGGDVKMYSDSAKAISGWGHAIPGMFPTGTESGHNTKAKEAVWSDRAGFIQAAAKLSDAADKLAQLADANDKAGFAAQFQTMGSACGACHRAYRNRS